MNKRKIVAIAGAGVAVAVGSVTVGANAFAAATAAPPVVKACVTSKGGVMHAVSAKTTKCPSGQYLLTWNQAGVAGKAGPAGKPGVAGKAGVAGKNGLNGKDGAAGKDGVAGKDGAIGPRGFTGATGAPGKNGDPGKKGDTGQSALEIWQQDGHGEGTLEEYSKSLKGKPGENGKSVTLNSAAAEPMTGRSFTLSCSPEETAIGASFQQIAKIPSLLLSSYSNGKDWTLTFALPTTVNATAICVSLTK